MTDEYIWTDNPTVSGIATCDTDILNDCLMHLKYNGSSSRNIGEIVTSLIPLTDAGLHLLDGALLQYGSYRAYIDYMAELYEDNPTANYFAQPTEWAFQQPILTANGTLGGDSFAVASYNAEANYPIWQGFDGSTSTNWLSNGDASSTYFIFYNPIPIKVTSLQITNRTGVDQQYNRAIRSGTVYGSNDNETYTQIGIFTNSDYTIGSIWSIDLSTNTNYYKYYKVECVGDGTAVSFSEVKINATYLLNAEQSWQQSVTTYGSCGKFVYDSVNKTIRLPKVSDILQGTTDVTALGDLIEAGLPNITGTFNAAQDVSPSGAFQTDYNGHVPYARGDWSSYVTSFNASRSSEIYGNSPTVQPQTILGLIYIVIATSTKTQIQVDIDEVMTDLNGKADVDLTNVTNTSGFRKLVELYKNGTSWYKVFREYDPSTGNLIGLWCEQGGVVSADTISFLKTYVDTNYNLQLTIGNNDTGAYQHKNYPYSKTTTGFTTSGATGFTVKDWRACGYIA